MLKLKDNFCKHPKTTPRGCEKVKKIDEESEQDLLFTVEPFLRKYRSDRIEI